MENIKTEAAPESVRLCYRRYHHIPERGEERAVYERDLMNMGYDGVKAKKFLGGNASMAKELFEGRMPDSGISRKGKYRRLPLISNDKGAQRSSNNWALFDPFFCSLDNIDKEDLPLVVKLAFYEPGNEWFLEQNTESKAIRMRSHNVFPRGKRVQYTVNGPVLFDTAGDVDVKIVKVEQDD